LGQVEGGGPLLLIYNVREEGRPVVIATSKLTEKYQITIPAAVRQQLGLKAGDSVLLVVEDGQVVLRGAPGGWTESSRGLGAEMWKQVGGAAAIERERDSWE
jgi:AbrB family looped-hinge helix DNA binding protein